MSRDKSRAALLRLRRWKVDEIRKEIGALEAQRQMLVDEGAALETRLLVEQAAAGSGDDAVTAHFAYGGFARKVIADRERLAAGIGDLDDQITAVRDRLREAFLDLKQLEIVERKRKEREAAEKARLEAQSLDEAALQGFVRKGRA